MSRTLLTATIHVDGIAYGGIDPDGRDDTQLSPAFRNGFHQHGSGLGRDALKWGGEPYVIVSPRNLRGHLDRIMARIEDGSLSAGVITIQLVPGGVAEAQGAAGACGSIG